MMVSNVLIVAEDAPGALYHSYRRGFEELGVSVTGYCPVTARTRGSQFERSRVARRLMPQRVASLLNERVADDLATAKADLVLVLKGEQFTAKTIRHLKAVSGAPVVNFYPDDPFADVRSSRLVFGPEVLASYDLCFTFARHLLPSYQAAGVRDARYLPFARDPGMHSPAAAVAEPDFDIVFIGNLDAERVGWLEAVADHKLVIYGEYTAKAIHGSSPLRRATFLPAVYGDGFAHAIRRGKIALNVMRKLNTGSHNMRSYESPACAAFTLSQRTPELVDLFREDEEVVFFGSREELRAKVAKWAGASSEERDRIALAGFRRVEHDTYARRAETIVTSLGARTPIGASE